MSKKKLRHAIVEATLSLLDEQAWQTLTWRDIAAKAGVSKADIRSVFQNKTDIIAAYMRAVDQAILEEGLDKDMQSAPPRERLLDILMNRLDLLAEHREAIRQLMQAASCDPALALCWNRLSVNSMMWMMEAAEMNVQGPRRAMRAQALTLAYADTIRVWLRDDSQEYELALKRLDEHLRRGEKWIVKSNKLACKVKKLCACLPRKARASSENAAHEDIQPETV